MDFIYFFNRGACTLFHRPQKGLQLDNPGAVRLSWASKAMFVQTSLVPFYSFEASVSSDGNSYFFKKLKHKRKLKKLQTDLATAKQEAAITVMELNEKIRTLHEGKTAPRGQYYHVTVARWPWVVQGIQFYCQHNQSRATVPGSILAWPGLHSARIATLHKLRTPGWVHCYCK